MRKRFNSGKYEWVTENAPVSVAIGCIVVCLFFGHWLQSILLLGLTLAAINLRTAELYSDPDVAVRKWSIAWFALLAALVFSVR